MVVPGTDSTDLVPEWREQSLLSDKLVEQRETEKTPISMLGWERDLREDPRH